MSYTILTCFTISLGSNIVILNELCEDVQLGGYKILRIC